MALNLVGTSGNATIDADTGISGFTIDFDVWTTATRPATPSTGDTGFNSDLNCLETYNGSAWVSQLPSQTGNNGKYLTTNGTSPSWATIDALPSQTGNNGKYLTTNGSVASWAAVAGGPEWQAVQTGNFNATAGNAYPIDTTSASVTVTLPASPTVGQQIILTDYAGTWATNTVTVNPNGNKIVGETGNGTLYVNKSTCSLIYIDSTRGWISYSNITPAFGPGTVEYLVVAGGGGGGSTRGGGGGAGGYRTASGLSVSTGSAITVTVGAGGAGAIASSGGVSQGSDSVFGSITSVGGGYGRGRYESGASGSPNGGSGGGGSEAGGSSTAGTGTSGQGYAGGNSFSTHGGGGGGAAEVGYNTGNGNGGAGLSSSISGTLTYYAGGGGGGAYTPTTGGTGGTGGGGRGGDRSQNGTAGTANTGGGGGGGGDEYNGANGGSGIVIIRYDSVLPPPVSTTGSPTVTVGGGYRIYKWTSSGSITF